jgi:hypothetical protein
LKLSLAEKSILLLVSSIVALVVLTILDSQLAVLSFGMQRLITLMLLILPPTIGSAFGVASLVRKEGRTWLAVTGMVLNTLFAFFHMMIIMFAG